MRAFDAKVTVWVRIEVNDENVIDRCVNNEDGWRDSLYNLQTPEEVIGHLAYNSVVNDVQDVRRLDGWADVAEGAVSFRNQDMTT